MDPLSVPREPSPAFLSITWWRRGFVITRPMTDSFVKIQYDVLGPSGSVPRETPMATEELQQATHRCCAVISTSTLACHTNAAAFFYVNLPATHIHQVKRHPQAYSH